MRTTVWATLVLAACSGGDGKPTDDTGPVDTDDTGTDVIPAEDRDGDGFSPGPDCDDHNADINPNVTVDVCNGVDDDCDGDIDEDPDLSWFFDGDGDGFGEEGSASFVACEPGGAEYASNDADCDDGDSEVFPGADEVCDGIDNDCNGGTDDDPTLYGAWYPDVDRDGYGDDDATATEGCQPGEDWVDAQGDCDDSLPTVNPAGDETCNDLDDDCNGEIDEDESEWSDYWQDADGDGAGVATVVRGCDAESAGGVENTWDCDDGDPREPVFVSVYGSARGDGSLDRPYDSVQDALGVSYTCVSVGAGTYYEDINFSGRSVTVESQEGSGSTTLQGTGREPVVTIYSGETATLRGFTVTNGGGSQTSGSSYYYDGSNYIYYYYTYEYGGGAYVTSSTATFDDVKFEANPLQDYYYYYASSTSYYYGYSYGGAIYANYADITLTDVDMHANNASYGSAIYTNSSTITGTRVRISENTDDYYTVYDNYGVQDWENLIFSENSSRNAYSSLYAYDTEITLTNATIVGNDYGVLTYYGDVTVDSSIIADNVYYGLGEYDTSGATWIVAYNDVYGNGTDYYGVTDYTGYTGNISQDPGLYDFNDDDDSDNDDLTLLAASPCVDAGNPAGAHDDIDGTNNDIGAYGGPEASW